MSTTVKNSKMARRYEEEFKRQAVELLIHSGKTLRVMVPIAEKRVARDLFIAMAKRKNVQPSLPDSLNIGTGSLAASCGRIEGVLCQTLLESVVKDILKWPIWALLSTIGDT